MATPMIVKKPFRPTGSGSKMLNVGDPFTPLDATQERVFRALGRIGDAPPKPAAQPPAAPPAYRSRAVVAEESALPPATEAQPATGAQATRRPYKRRDLTAEK